MNPTETVDNDLRRKLHSALKTGLLLTATSDLETIVQAATDSGLELIGAQFGVFFYNVIEPSGEGHLHYTLSGADRESFGQFPMPRNTADFAPTFQGRGVVRYGDITKDQRYGQKAPHFGMPAGHLPVRSYLAVAVKAQSGEVLGGLFYGHEDPNIFEQESEDLVAAIAGQAATAIENARLRDELKKKIEVLENTQRTDREISKRLAESAAIVESSQDVIISKDLNGIITTWNQAASRLFGYSSEEIVGKSILTLIPPHLHRDEKMIIENIRAGRRIEHFETVRMTKSGQSIQVSLTISPIKDADGNIIGASKIIRDISTQKRMEQSLLQAEKIASAGRMAATIAHEINNPLEAIANLLFLLRSSITDQAALQLLDTAESELARVSHIARQTLGFYRENAQTGAYSISELAEHSISIYEPRCLNIGIEVERSLKSRTRLAMHRGEIIQVISNLIANSMHAMSGGGHLVVMTRDTRNPGHGVILKIKDNGIGIPAANLAHVFDVFFTTRRDVGTGIGLFVAKQFIEAHGGSIEIRSPALPEAIGTEVTIFLPEATPYAKELPSDQTHSPPRMSGV